MIVARRFFGQRQREGNASIALVAGNAAPGADGDMMGRADARPEPMAEVAASPSPPPPLADRERAMLLQFYVDGVGGVELGTLYDPSMPNR